MITRHNVIQGSPEWQHMREGRYTGSGADKLLKFGAIDYSLTQAIEIFNGNFWTERGHRLEDEAIGLYEDLYHISVDRVGIVYNSLYPNCAYSPDGVAGEILIEVKCFNEDNHLEIVNSELPFEILAQVHFGLLICGLPEAHVILYHPKVDPKRALKIFTVKADTKILTNFKNILKGKK
jgi:hypothetical protein